MANYCYNQITLTGDTASLRKLESRLIIAEDNILTKYLHESADKLGIAYSKPALKPHDVVVQLHAADDDSSKLIINFETKWWFDEQYIALAALVFADFDMDFYAEEFESAGCFRAVWAKGHLKSSEDDVHYVSYEDEDGEYRRAVQWRVSGWELNEEPKTAEEAFTFFAENEDEEVRWFAAEHPDIPLPLLNRLLTDESEFVAAAARSNPALV